MSPVQVETAEGCCPGRCSAAVWAVGNTQGWKSLYYRRSPDEPKADLPALSTQKYIHYIQPHQHLCCDLFTHLSLSTLKGTHTICIRDWLLTVPTWLANVFVCVRRCMHVHVSLYQQGVWAGDSSGHLGLAELLTDPPGVAETGSHYSWHPKDKWPLISDISLTHHSSSPVQSGVSTVPVLLAEKQVCCCRQLNPSEGDCRWWPEEQTVGSDWRQTDRFLYIITRLSHGKHCTWSRYNI